MTREVIYIGFYSPKGGVGKSTFTILFASWLHYQKGFNVAIVDADYPQTSIHRTRRREVSIIEANEQLQQKFVQQFEQSEQKLYPIIQSNASYALSDWLNFKTGNPNHAFDVVLFDLPGTTNTDGVMETISTLDHIFVPIAADPLVMESALPFLKTVNESIIGTEDSQLQGAHLFWTKVDKREKTGQYGKYETVMRNHDFSLLKTQVSDRKRFNKEVESDSVNIYRSTIFPADRRFMRESNLEELFSEICTIISIQKYE